MCCGDVVIVERLLWGCSLHMRRTIVFPFEKLIIDNVYRHTQIMSSVPEYTRRAIKRYREKNRVLIKQKKQAYYLQHAEAIKRKRRERYQKQKVGGVAVLVH